MLSNTRRRIAVISAVAVLAALVPALSSSPASAAPATTPISVVDAGAAYLACPASANIPSAGFTDTTDASVDCLKYYGIVNGTTATTYSPTDSVSRWQMALFITRTLDTANVALGTGADQGFTDIAGLSAEIQTAVNQLKQLGITTGKTATTYAPNDNVSRQEMALFIERMLDNLPAGPGGTQEADGVVAASAVTYVNSDCGGTYSSSCTGKYNYSDIDSGSVTVEASLAIKELYTLGIHDGVSATTFNPTADMTRAAMATFINAALDHSHLRPEGLHLQSSAYTAIGTHTPTLSVSYRDASFDPIASAAVDVFYWTNSTTEGNTAFGATGLCNSSAGTSDSITKCYIDVSETGTDENGNMTPTANGTAPVSTIYNGTDTYHAWTGAAATTYDNDLHGEAASPLTHSSIDVVATPAAAALRCSVDTPANAKTATAAHTVKFGTTHTVTCQVVNGGAVLATAGAVPLPLSPVRLDRTRVFTTDSSGAQSGETLEAVSTVSYTGADGSVSWTVTGPTDTTGTDLITESYQITSVGAALQESNAGTTSVSGFMADDGTDLQFSLLYTDTTAAKNSVTMTQTATSAKANATTGITRSVTASVWDQYGDGVGGETVTFTSASELPDNLGMICTGATPTVCTAIGQSGHGLAIGDDVRLVSTKDLSSCTDATATTATAGDVYTVATTSFTATTFSLTNQAASDFVVGCGVASDAATPTKFDATSFAPTNNTRTSSTAGTATFSWIDTEGTSGRDVVTASTTGGTAPTKSATFFRLATAASFAEDGNGTGAVEDAEIVGRVVEFDATGDDFILEVTDAKTGNLTLTMTSRLYYQYNYDANDQFATGGTNAAPSGTATTMALFETAMAGLAAANTGAGSYDDSFGVEYAALSTGVSRFYMN